MSQDQRQLVAAPHCEPKKHPQIGHSGVTNCTFCEFHLDYRRKTGRLSGSEEAGEAPSTCLCPSQPSHLGLSFPLRKSQTAHPFPHTASRTPASREPDPSLEERHWSEASGGKKGPNLP